MGKHRYQVTAFKKEHEFVSKIIVSADNEEEAKTIGYNIFKIDMEDDFDFVETKKVER